MSYYGSWNIDDLLTFHCNTTRFDTGNATDADSAPSYRVYEDETGTAILTGTMALLDSANTAGFYSEQITLSAANGFERGKSYSIYIAATVNSVAGASSHSFQVLAPVDLRAVAGTSQTAGDLAALLAAIGAKTTNLPADPADASDVAAAITAALTTALAESYRANGATGSVAQLLYEILGNLVEANNSGTTRTVKGLDHSTTKATYTYDNSTPNTITRAT